MVAYWNSTEDVIITTLSASSKAQGFVCFINGSKYLCQSEGVFEILTLLRNVLSEVRLQDQRSWLAQFGPFCVEVASLKYVVFVFHGKHNRRFCR